MAAIQPAYKRILLKLSGEALMGDDAFGINRDTLQLETVGATFGDQVIRNAIWAILLSFVVIILYLGIRFEY